MTDMNASSFRECMHFQSKASCVVGSSPSTPSFILEALGRSHLMLPMMFFLINSRIVGSDIFLCEFSFQAPLLMARDPTLRREGYTSQSSLLRVQIRVSYTKPGSVDG
jgi:hypothetical protein